MKPNSLWEKREMWIAFLEFSNQPHNETQKSIKTVLGPKTVTGGEKTLSSLYSVFSHNKIIGNVGCIYILYINRESDVKDTS